MTRLAADEKDNTRYAFLQLDDRVLVYRGADQPNMSVINPESDVWQHIKVNLRSSSGEKVADTRSQTHTYRQIGQSATRQFRPTGN